MPDNIGNTSQATTTSAQPAQNGGKYFAAPGKPGDRAAKPAANPASNAGATATIAAPPQPRGNSGLKTEADYEAMLANGDDESRSDAQLPDVSDLLADGDSATDTADPIPNDDPADPVDSADAESDTDTTQTSQTKDADDFDPVKIRESAQAQIAALTLLDAGISPATVKSMFASDKAGLIALAQKLAQPQSAPGTADSKTESAAPATDADPLDAVWKETLDSLKDHIDEDAIPKFIAPMQAMAKTFRSLLEAETKKIRDDYGAQFKTVGNNSAAFQVDYAEQRLVNDYPQLKDTTNREKWLAKMNELGEKGKSGKGYPSIGALAADAAKDLWGADREQVRRDEASARNKQRSQGQPTVRDGRGEQAATGQSKEVTYDQLQQLIYEARSNAKSREEGDTAVANVKKRFKVKAGPRL